MLFYSYFKSLVGKEVTSFWLQHTCFAVGLKAPSGTLTISSSIFMATSTFSWLSWRSDGYNAVINAFRERSKNFPWGRPVCTRRKIQTRHCSTAGDSRAEEWPSYQWDPTLCGSVSECQAQWCSRCQREQISSHGKGNFPQYLPVMMPKPTISLSTSHQRPNEGTLALLWRHQFDTTPEYPNGKK